MISKNISLYELLQSRDYPDLAAKAHDLPTQTTINLCRLTFQVLQPLRDRFGPVVIASGYRSQLLNERVGGADDSAHVQGRAADIALPRASEDAVWDLFKSGEHHIEFDRVAFYPGEGRFHVEVAEEGTEPRGLLFEATPTWRAVP